MRRKHLGIAFVTSFGALASLLRRLTIAAVVILMVFGNVEGQPPPGDTHIENEICGSCRPDATSPTGASQFCKISNDSARLPCVLDEEDPEIPRPPIEGDEDRDGLVDTYESELLETFAPKIWLHPDENRWPVNVDWLLSRSTLRHSHARCPDHEILAFGQVTRNNITEQLHRNAHDLFTFPPWDACDHYGPNNRSDSYTADPKESFFLQFSDAAHRGSTLPRDWVLYGHVYPVFEGIVIQYWQLYAYNDSFASANHEGDWEYTSVLIDRQERAQRVVYYRHGHARDAAADRVEWEGSHHITYVAKGGHAQYRAFETETLDFPGSCDADSAIDETQGFADKCGQGTAWKGWEPEFGGVVNVGEKFAPLNGSNWLRYSGLWGEIGAAADVVTFTSGPQGPAYQSSNWNWKP